MGENSKIEWTDHTFNPWIGCTKVSAGCANCYAEQDFDKRKDWAKWGRAGTRIVTKPSYWHKPIRWDEDAAFAEEYNAQAQRNTGERPYPDRPKVFCASLADVFEDWSGPMHERTKDAENGVVNSVLWHRNDLGVVNAGGTTLDLSLGERWATMDDLRRRLFITIEATPNLDWLLLTKRPENVLRMVPGLWLEDWPHNAWLGTSVEDQSQVKRAEELKKIPARIRFLSVEPMLGRLDLDLRAHPGMATFHEIEYWERNRIHWVIAGGESGINARPCRPDWVRSLRDQCIAAGIPFHFKQWGEWVPVDDETPQGYPLAIVDCRPGDAQMVRVGKVRAGRMLDGREWNEVPKTVFETAVAK